MTEKKKAPTKDEVFGILEKKCKVSREWFDKECDEALEFVKARFPDDHELRALKSVFESAMALMKSGGTTLYGFVVGYDSLVDTNELILKAARAAKANSEPDAVKEFEETYMCKLEPDGSVTRFRDDGSSYNIKGSRWQRTVYGLCEHPESNKLVPFRLFWGFADPSKGKKPSALFIPIEFRGIPKKDENSGGFNITSVNETDFKATKHELPPFEEAIKKVYALTKLDALKTKEKGTNVVIRGKLYGLRANAMYGDRYTLPVGEDYDPERREIDVQLAKDFDMNQVRGFVEGVPCLIWGNYQPYEDKLTKNKVEKVQASGIYVLEKERIETNTSSNQSTLTKEETSDIETKWAGAE